MRRCWLELTQFRVVMLHGLLGNADLWLTRVRPRTLLNAGERLDELVASRRCRPEPSPTCASPCA